MNVQEIATKLDAAGERIAVGLLFVIAYAIAMYALMWLFVGFFHLSDPQFPMPGVYFIIHSLFHAPAALVTAVIVATRSTQLQRRGFACAALAAIVACAAACFLIDHWLALIFSHAALVGGFFLYRRASKLTTVA